MKKVVIFDMDGTLIDSGEDITHSINYVRQKIYDLAPLSIRNVVDAINGTSKNLAFEFYETHEYENSAKCLFEEHYYTQCIQNVYLYEGVFDMLTKLNENNVFLGIATNAPSQFAKRMLKHLEVDHFFPLILGANDVSEPKPSPLILEKHLNYHGFDRKIDQGWMVGDNHKDIAAAHAAGITSVFVTWGFSQMAGKSDFHVVRPQELVSLVLQ